MSKHSRRLRGVLLMLAPVLALPTAALAECPSKAEVEKAFDLLSKGEKIEVKKLGPAPLKGLCEVQFKGSRGFGVVYVDEKAELIFSGDIIEAKSRRSLTRDLLAELNAPTPLVAAELQKAATFAALTFGKGEKVVYFITDPL